MSAVLLHLSHTDICGDGRILKELSAVSDIRGYEVHAIGVSDRDGDSGMQRLEGASVSSIRLFTAWSRKIPRPVLYAFNLLELTLRLWRRGLRLKPALVHCHDTLVLPAGVLIKWTTGAKLLYDAHELESDKAAQSPTLSKATLAIERVSWSSVDGFISVSPSIMEWYASNLGPKPSALVLNAPIIGHASPGATTGGNRLRSRFGIPEDRLIFIFVGYLVQNRGINAVLDVFTRGNIRSHVVFVGQGPMEGIIAEHARRADNIHLHELVPHDAVVSLVRNADVGLCLIENVSLSSYYCLPNKLFEYSFAGLPVLASRFPDMEALVVARRLGWCVEVDRDAIEDAVRRIETTGAQGISADLSDLSWEAQVEKVRDLYALLLQVNGGMVGD